MTVLAHVRAPASTANLGPGFDCAAAALDLWNELEVTEADGEVDLDHLGVQAFALIAAPEGKHFSFTGSIPRARGLGSSASVIALGLLAAAVVEGRTASPEELLAEGIALEGHGDNLAAALAGGVCLTWGTAIARLADRAPAVPIAVIPDAVVPTAAARDALPSEVPYADAAFTAGRAALLGAALASGSEELFSEALHDRLHEPYRARAAPLLDMVRESLPPRALGATLSGSGPTVIVWAPDDHAAACADELARSHPAAQVMILAVSPKGAHAL